MLRTNFETTTASTIGYEKESGGMRFFLGGFGVLLVNAYVSYRSYCEQHNIKPLSHYEFRRSIALAWLHQPKYWPDRYKRRGAKRKVSQESDLSNTKSVRTTRSVASTLSSSTGAPPTGRAPRLTVQLLDPVTGALRI